MSSVIRTLQRSFLWLPKYFNGGAESPKEQKVIVEGLNIVTKHVKPRQMGQQGGIVKCEAPLYACKVMAVCPHCGKPTRLGHKIEADGSKSRVCKNADCGKSY